MPKPLVGDVLNTSRTPGWVNHPENDLLQPVGASAIVGEEKLVSDDGPFKSALSTYPSNKKSYRYLYHDENDIPIGAMQIRTLGPRSKKAVIQNLHVSKDNRRQKIATKLLYRARQDFDVKHSHDLTTMGKEFSKAVKSSGGSVQPSLEQMKQELDAYHGSPHRFPPTEKNPLGEFDPTKIGTGEGAQAYGYGHYLAESPDVAKVYQPRDFANEKRLLKLYNAAATKGDFSAMEILENSLTHKTPTELRKIHGKAGEHVIKQIEKIPRTVGALYHIRIPHEHIEKMLDWDKPLSEQHPHVQAAIRQELPDAPHDTLGQDLYNQYGMTAKAASDKLRRAGVAGIKYLDQFSRDADAGEGTRNFVVFPGNEHIMKVVHREAKGGAIHEGNSVRVTTYKAKGGAVNDGNHVRVTTYKADGGQPFYSPVDQAISKLSQAKGTGDQYLSMIRNTHGVKPQEIEDRGLEQKMTGKMGLPDVQRIASENPMPKITESVAHKSDFFVTQKGDDDKHYVLNDTGKRIEGPFETKQNAEGAINRLKDNKTQYEKYQLKGGNNYREIKLKLPVQKKNMVASKDGELGPKELGYGTTNNFKSSHFKDEPNILAHARVSDRKGPNGEKILHVEEIQSDWHQQARDLRHEEIDRLVENGMLEEEAKKSVPTNWGYGTPEDRKHIVDKLARDEKLTPEEESRRKQLLSNRVVPNAPFKKDWHELALKHLLDHAVKNGYDKMIITQGAEQAKRYDLSKHIGEINYKHNPDKTVSLMATDKESGSTVLHEEDVPHHKIHRYVGKGIAKKIMAGEGTPYQVSIPYEGGSMPIPTPARHAGKMTLSNLDLKTGDEGMKGFYDKIVPDFLNKYGKKWGAKVGTYRMADPNKDYNWSDYIPTIADMNRIGMERFGADRADMTSEQSAEAKKIHEQSVAEQRAMNLHSFDITPQMREDIMSKGQSRYNKGGSVKPLPAEAGSTPLKEGHVRLYHQTDENNLRKIEREGLLLKHAKGIEGPRAIYAGETPFYGKAAERPTLEFQVPKEHWQSPFVLRDVAPKDIIAAHYPWHRHARYLDSEDNKQSLDNVLTGKHDNLGGDTGKAVQYIKAKYGVKKFSGGAVKPLSLDAMRYALMAKGGKAKDLTKYTDPPSTKIADWKWRDLPEVAADINMKEVPDYIQKNYGEFMKQQLDRAKAGDMTARDFLKAYGITQSSIGRSGLSYDTATKTGMKLPRQDVVRPEGAFSEWLGSKKGQSFLKAAEKGDVNEDSLEDMKEKFSPFSMTGALSDKLRWAVKHSKNNPNLANLFATMPIEHYRDLMMGIKGIGPAKSGFIGSLLGRGDLPTLDARQVLLHTGKYNKDPEFQRRTQAIVKGKPVAGTEAVDRLIARQNAMGMDIDPSLEPFRQHLTHHAVWDKAGNSETTHGDVVKAMKDYKKGGDVEVKPTAYDPNLQRRHPEIEEAAKKFQSGKINRKQYDNVVNKHKPVKPYTFVPQPATDEDADRSLQEKQKLRWRNHEAWPEKRRVGLRLDIPAYENHGVWVNSIHDEEGSGEDKYSTSYGPVSSVKNAEFHPHPEKGIQIATGEKNKSPFAKIIGDLHHMKEDEAVEHFKKHLNHPDWTQVGYDPRRHGEFYDRKTMKPVHSAEHVIQIGPLVLAKNVKYKESSSYKLGGDVQSKESKD